MNEHLTISIGKQREGELFDQQIVTGMKVGIRTNLLYDIDEYNTYMSVDIEVNDTTGAVEISINDMPPSYSLHKGVLNVDLLRDVTHVLSVAAAVAAEMERAVREVDTSALAAYRKALRELDAAEDVARKQRQAAIKDIKQTALDAYIKALSPIDYSQWEQE